MSNNNFYEIDWRKVGGWATLVAVSMVAYYSISAYKSYLEVKKLKSKQHE